MRAAHCLAAATILAAACSGGPDTGSRERPATYQAHIDATALGDPPVPGSFSGTWKLELQGTRYVLSQEGFGTVTEEIEVRDDRLFVIATPAPTGAFNCYSTDGGRVTGEQIRARYSLGGSGDRLELGVLHEPCPLRGLILDRTWRPVE